MGDVAYELGRAMEERREHGMTRAKPRRHAGSGGSESRSSLHHGAGSWDRDAVYVGGCGCGQRLG